MSYRICPGARRGAVKVPVSKSEAHRALICAALSEGSGERSVLVGAPSEDIFATLDCLKALGAGVTMENGAWARLTPLTAPRGETALLDVRESGSTLRFLLPLCGALGQSARLKMHGRLPQRPMTPFIEALTLRGMRISSEGDELICEGQLQSGDFALPGNVSSQFVSGLLFALPLLKGDSRILLTSAMESAGYIDLTLSALADSGVQITKAPGAYLVPGGQSYQSPSCQTPGGDWSGAAAFLCMGALPGGRVNVGTLSYPSPQGDSQVLELLKRMGAQVDYADGSLCARGETLCPIDIDVSQIPDLAPALAALLCGIRGVSRILNAGRLRMKESDRLNGTASLLKDLGADVRVEGDSLIICGTGRLAGGRARVLGDHRLAMAAAVAACSCDAEVEIDEPACVAKSFPDFWTQLEALEVLR